RDLALFPPDATQFIVLIRSRVSQQPVREVERTIRVDRGNHGNPLAERDASRIGKISGVLRQGGPQDVGKVGFAVSTSMPVDDADVVDGMGQGGPAGVV